MTENYLPSGKGKIIPSWQIDSNVNVKSQKTTQKICRIFGLSVSALALMMGTRGVSRADTVHSTPDMQDIVVTPDTPYTISDDDVSIASLNGIGTVNVNNLNGFSVAAGTGDGNNDFYTKNVKNSVFSGTINAQSYGNLMSIIPGGVVTVASEEKYNEGAEGSAIILRFDSPYTELNKASIQSPLLLGLGDFQDSMTGKENSIFPQATAYIHNGSTINAGEVLIGAGVDQISSPVNKKFGVVSPYQPVVNAKANVVLADAGTHLQTSQLILGQQVPPDANAVLDDNGKYNGTHIETGKSSGTLWVANGSSVTVSGGGVNGGIYLGNSSGTGRDARIDNGMYADNPDNYHPHYPENNNNTDKSLTGNQYALPDGDGTGTIYITGDQVGYDDQGKQTHEASTGHGGQVTVQDGGLWIGPVNGGKGSGDIIVDHGGQLNLDNSFTVLGGQNGAGNVAINEGGSLDVTGMSPVGVSDQNSGPSLSQQRQGAVTIANGSALNIGNATTAGLLKLYGDLDLQKGSTTTFYEGTTTASGNKGDANNSHVEVNGNVTLGGNIQIAGITGQNKGTNGAVDAGMYHLIDYTGTLSGQKASQLVKTATGQTLSYVHDDATKSVDVLVAAVTGSNGGSASNNGENNTGASGNANRGNIVTQADGQNGTVTLSIPTGSRYVLGGDIQNGGRDLSTTDYETLKAQGLTDDTHKVIDAENLNINGGGELQVGNDKVAFVHDLTGLTIDNGKLSYINHASTLSTDDAAYLQHPSSDVALTLHDHGTLYISGPDSRYGTIYNAFRSINGNGSIILDNTFGTDKDGVNLYVYGAGSVFSGSIKGDGAAADGYGSDFDINAPSFSLDKASVSNLGNVKISSPGYNHYTPLTKDQATMGNAFFHDGTTLDAARLTVAESKDGISYGASPNKYEELYLKKNQAGFNNATLVVKDQTTSLQVRQLVLGQQNGISSSKLSALKTESGGRRDSNEQDITIRDPKLSYGAAHGTLWLADGAAATVSGGGATGGVYLGNSVTHETGDYKASPDAFEAEGEGHGILHITGDQVGYDASGNVVDSGTAGQSARMTVQNGGVWVGPVDGGKGSGDIIVDHGGQLALDNSFTVLGGQNGAGNVAINQGGSLDVTGMNPADLSDQNKGPDFNQQRQGAVTIANGGALNIGNATTAGLLKLYGDLDLQKGSTTTFYEGTTTARAC